MGLPHTYGLSMLIRSRSGIVSRCVLVCFVVGVIVVTVATVVGFV